MLQEPNKAIFLKALSLNIRRVCDIVVRTNRSASTFMVKISMKNGTHWVAKMPGSRMPEWARQVGIGWTNPFSTLSGDASHVLKLKWRSRPYRVSYGRR